MCVVGGIGAQSREGVGDPTVLVLCEGRMDVPFPADGGLGGIAGRVGRTEATEPVGRQDLGLVPEFTKTSRGRVLKLGEVLGVDRS